MRSVIASFVILFWAATLVTAQPAIAFDCAETKCGDMRTCAEAHHKLTVCGHKKRDADNDGIPCEALCGADMATYLARVKAQMPDAVDGAEEAASSRSLSLVGTAQADDGGSATADGAAFACAGKKTCKQMVSCAEAKFYLAQCGVKSLDGDRDGTPCNSLCR
jgi:hypothetical protein